MKKILAAALAMLVLSTAHATDVGVSIAISQPGVYGRIDIGHFPQPAVVVAQPVIIAPAPVGVVVQPVYMWVPKGHRKDWSKHCRHYNACGVPVYFVRHDWYDQQVRYSAQPYRVDGGDGHGKGKSQGNGKGKGRD
jgi:hypothetical protein